LSQGLQDWLRSADEAGLDPDGISALFADSLRDFLDRRGGTVTRRGARGRRTSKSGTRAGEVA
jgi:hypothetical protein